MCKIEVLVRVRIVLVNVFYEVIVLVNVILIRIKIDFISIIMNMFLVDEVWSRKMPSALIAIGRKLN